MGVDREICKFLLCCSILCNMPSRVTGSLWVGGISAVGSLRDLCVDILLEVFCLHLNFNRIMHNTANKCIQEHKWVSLGCVSNSPFVRYCFWHAHPLVNRLQMKDDIMLADFYATMQLWRHSIVSLGEILPLCHYSGSKGLGGPFHQQTQTMLDGLVTTWHHRHSLHCPQRSKVACCAVRAKCIRF